MALRNTQNNNKKNPESVFSPPSPTHPPLTELRCFFTPVHVASFQQRRAEPARRSRCCYPSLWQLQYDWLTQPPLLLLLPLPLPCVWLGLGADDGSVGGALGLVSPLPKRNVVFGGRRREGKAGNDTVILERWQVEKEEASLVVVGGRVLQVEDPLLVLVFFKAYSQVPRRSQLDVFFRKSKRKQKITTMSKLPKVLTVAL